MHGVSPVGEKEAFPGAPEPEQCPVSAPHCHPQPVLGDLIPATGPNRFHLAEALVLTMPSPPHGLKNCGFILVARPSLAATKAFEQWATLFGQLRRAGIKNKLMY